MITTDLTNKNKKKFKDNPTRLAMYLLWGADYEQDNQLNRVKYQGLINSDNEDLIDTSLQMIDLHNKKQKDNNLTLHLQVSLRPNEHLNDIQWKEIVDAHLKALGLEEHIGMYVVHKDTDNEHCHIAVSRVNPNTKKINRLSYSHKKLLVLDDSLEEKFKLQKDNHGNIENKTRTENVSDNIETHTGQQSLYSYIDNIRERLLNCESWKEFHTLCKENNLTVKKSGRGLVFETDNPNKPEEKIYIKGSAFSRTEGSLSLANLEKKLGLYEPITIDELDKIPVKKKYEAEPVSFAQNNEVQISNEQIQSLFNEFRQAQAKNNENIKLLREEKKRLKAGERYKLNKLKKEHLNNIKTLENMYSGQILENRIKQEENEYAQKVNDLKEYVKTQIDDLQKKLDTSKKFNFLDYLKDKTEITNIEGISDKRLLLLSKKTSMTQYVSVNYAEIQKRERQELNKMDYKGGLVKTSLNYMKLGKTTSKGQNYYVPNNPKIADFIKDTGRNVFINDYPNMNTMRDFIKIIEVQAQDNPVKLHGNSEFQRIFMEMTLEKNLKLTFTDNNVQKQYGDRLNEQRRNDRNIRELGEFRRNYTGQRNSARFRGNTFGKSRKQSRPIFRIKADKANTVEQYSTIRTSTNRITNFKQNLSRNKLGQKRKRSQEKQVSNVGSMLQNMSERSMAGAQEKDTVLLHNNLGNSVDLGRQRGQIPRVRWSLHRESESTELKDIKSVFNENNKKEDIYSVKNINIKEYTDEIPSEIETDNSSSELSEAVKNFLDERNSKHALGIKDVLEHQIINTQTGRFIYKGLRNIDKEKYVLLQQDNIIYLKKLTKEYEEKRLKQTKLGSEITINSKGQIINKNINKNKEKAKQQIEENSQSR